MITLDELEQKARNGHRLAQLSLGTHCYQTNDLVRATKYLNWAAIRGCSESIALLDKIKVDKLKAKLGKANK